ncbi:MAG: hypothetical protein V3V49_13165 [Candidatus Krumholzibacteria bacterium]
MRILRVSIPLLVAVAFAWGCEHAPPFEAAGGPTTATFASIQANIFSRSCAITQCHIGSSAPLGLDLSDGRAFGNLVKVRSAQVPALFRVDPGAPDSSYLVLKVEGVGGIVGAQMPRGRAPLAQDEINAIRQWIAGGANP